MADDKDGPSFFGGLVKRAVDSGLLGEDALRLVDKPEGQKQSLQGAASPSTQVPTASVQVQVSNTATPTSDMLEKARQMVEAEMAASSASGPLAQFMQNMSLLEDIPDMGKRIDAACKFAKTTRGAITALIASASQEVVRKQQSAIGVLELSASRSDRGTQEAVDKLQHEIAGVTSQIEGLQQVITGKQSEITSLSTAREVARQQELLEKSALQSAYTQYAQTLADIGKSITPA